MIIEGRVIQEDDLAQAAREMVSGKVMEGKRIDGLLDID